MSQQITEIANKEQIWVKGNEDGQKEYMWIRVFKDDMGIYFTLALQGKEVSKELPFFIFDSKDEKYRQYIDYTQNGLSTMKLADERIAKVLAERQINTVNWKKLEKEQRSTARFMSQTDEKFIAYQEKQNKTPIEAQLKEVELEVESLMKKVAELVVRAKKYKNAKQLN